jgi:protease I
MHETPGISISKGLPVSPWRGENQSECRPRYDLQSVPCKFALQMDGSSGYKVAKEEDSMKRLLIATLVGTFVLSHAYAQNAPKVLLFMRNAQKSADLEYMLKKEVGVMKDALEKSGYKVIVATLDGSSFSAASTTVKADIKLANTKIAEYAGFILPCLAVPSYPAPPEVSPEAIALVKNAVAAGKPVAAQTGSLWTLAEAGLLKGKKYAYAMEEKNPYFAGATFAGTGVVRDGLIVTSGICPYMALKTDGKDGSEALALALVGAMREKK